MSLGLLTGKLTQGSSTLHNYRDDKRNMAKPGTFVDVCRREKEGEGKEKWKRKRKNVTPFFVGKKEEERERMNLLRGGREKRICTF